MKFDWNEDAIERLKTLAADPKGYTSAQIGEMMGGLTKNQIIGKLQRINGAPSKRSDERNGSISSGLARAPAGSQPKSALSEFGPYASWRQKHEAANRLLPTSRPVTLAKRERNQCCWPLGNPRDKAFRFCGASIEVPATYCDDHRAMAYRKVGEAA